MASSCRPISGARPADSGRLGGAAPASIPDAIEWLRKRFRSDRARGLSIAYQFELAGEGGGGLWVLVDDGRLEVDAGRAAAPDVTLRMPAADLFAILAGSANPDLLFMQRRIEIEGDPSLALKLRPLFN